MSLTETVFAGTVKADGTLELDGEPKLPPGRVIVVVRREYPPEPTAEGWWPYMQRVRAEREAAGCRFMNEAEMESRVSWLRDDEERIDGIRRELDEQRCRQEQP